MKNLTYIFVIFLGLEQNDLIEIKIQADNEWDAWSKVEKILGGHMNNQVTNLYLSDWYENI